MAEDRRDKWRRLNPETYRDQNTRHVAAHRARAKRRANRLGYLGGSDFPTGQPSDTDNGGDSE